MKRILLHTSVILFCLTACGKEPDPAPATTAAPPPGSARPGSRPDTHAEFLADLAAIRDPKDGVGRAWLESGPTQIQARNRATWTFGFEAGPLGVDQGGMVFLQISPFWKWSNPQTTTPDRPGFTTAEPFAELAQGDLLALETENPAAQLFAIKITGRALEPGEQLRITFANAIADAYAERESPFTFAVDGNADGIRSSLKEAPTVEITPGPPAQLVLNMPGTARPGETVRVTAALLDSTGSRGTDFIGELLIAGDERWQGLPERLTLTASDAGVAHFEFTLAADAPTGVLRLGAAVVSSQAARGRPLMTLSNPMLISPGAPVLLWADLHGHSNLSDGTGTPEDYFAYAREVAALDVVALTDHDHWGLHFLDDPKNAHLWQRIKDATRAGNQPGDFTSLLAFEWTSWLYGHRHVVYFEDEGQIISSMDADTDDPAELWDALRGQPALTFAHHSAGAPVSTDWAFAPDPELEPVTEISSVHGTSEAFDAPLIVRGAYKGNFVRDVLDRGQRLGFIGSGDSHDGHPGLAHLGSGTGGLAGIFATENTRPAIRAALMARACFATNGPRMLLLAKLGDFETGQAIPVKELESITGIDVQLFGTTPLTRLEVIRSGQVVVSFDADALEQDPDLPPDFAAHIDLASAGLTDLMPGEYVYLRAVQEGPGIAWSSAWFIE